MQLKFKKTLTSLLILTPLVITPVILLSNSTPLNSASNPITRSENDASSYVLDETITDMWTTRSTTIAKTTNGDVYSWGINNFGQTGLGIGTTFLTPTLLLDASDPTQSKGDFSTLLVNETIIDMWTMNNTAIAKTTNGNVYSWGYNSHGETGQGVTTDIITPTLLLDTSNPTQSKGDFANLSIGETIIDAWVMDGGTVISKTTNNNIYSWGINSYGQTGIGGSDIITPTLLLDASNPTQSKGDFTDLATNETIIDAWTMNDTIIVKTTNDDVFSWGSNSYGKAGVGSLLVPMIPTILLDTSTPINSKGEFTNLLVGETIIDAWSSSISITNVVFAKISNGDIYSWGFNFSGTTGINVTSQSISTPTLLLDSSAPLNSSGALKTLLQDETIIDMWISEATTFAKISNGDIYSWGWNLQGQTGTNGTIFDAVPPTLILDASEPSNSKGNFTSLSPNETIVDVWTMNNTIIAKTTNGDIYSWGLNTSGQTGLGGTTNVLTPTLLLDASDPTNSSGAFTNLQSSETIIDAWTMDNTIVVKNTNGNVYSWGYSPQGQTGLGGTTNILVPTLLFDGIKDVDPVDPINPVVPVAPKDPVIPVNPEVPSASSGGMSTGALVGIIIGSIAGVAVIGFGVWWYIKKIR